MKRAFASWIWLAAFFLSAASSEAAVTAVADADRDRITLGDVIKLVVKVEYPDGWQADLAVTEQDLLPFEILDRKTLQEGRSGASTLRRGFLINLTVFELGDLEIPPVPVVVTDPQGRRSLAATQPVRVQCVPVAVHPEKDDRIRPIKGPVSIGFRALRSLALAAAAIFLTIFLAVKIWMRRRSARRPDPESLKPPHERAMLEYGRLNARKLLEQSLAREHFGEWTDILRRYFERRFGIDTFDLTTSQTLALLGQRAFAPDVIERVSEFLREADLAKFARYVPSADSVRRLDSLFVAVVEATKETDQAPAAASPGQGGPA